jgi:uncharacterized membrane protein
MKSRIWIGLAAIASLAVLAPTARVTAQDPPAQTHYRVIDLGTLGTVSSGNAINNVGWVTGSSDQSGNAVQLATLWIFGQQIPLGTLGGPSSDVAWPVKNNFGIISGISENGKHDPLNESFSCPVFNLVSGNSCEAFVWEFGKIKQLPGLGGNNSIGAGNNNLGQIVGWAENNVLDPPATTRPANFSSSKPLCGGAISNPEIGPSPNSRLSRVTPTLLPRPSTISARPSVSPARATWPSVRSAPSTP